jgi:hypothetical protein
VSNYGLEHWAIEVRSPAKAKNFPLVSASRPVLGPTDIPVQWVPCVLSSEIKRGRSVTLTTHLHLVMRSRMSRSYTSSPPWATIGVLWDCFTFYTSLISSLPYFYFYFILFVSCLYLNLFPLICCALSSCLLYYCFFVSLCHTHLSGPYNYRTS